MDLAADIWVDSENIRQHWDEWERLFDGIEFFGDADERAEFDRLPDPITVYRGGGDDSRWSWTTERSVAEKFAGRSGRQVRERTLAKADCFGYLLRRNEFELLSWVGLGE